jgi:uncharacterized protein YwgA
MGNMNEKVKSLFTVIDKIEGRTKFQKLIFILKCKKMDFEFNFTYYYYGPYSSTLQLTIDDLVDEAFLDETRTSSSYLYVLRTGSKPEENDEISRNRELIKQINEIDTKNLELISTFFYLDEMGIIDENHLKHRCSILKPNLTDRIEECFNTYLELKATPTN